MIEKIIEKTVEKTVEKKKRKKKEGITVCEMRYIKQHPFIDALAIHSNNLYNEANYVMRQQYFANTKGEYKDLDPKEKKWFSAFELSKMFMTGEKKGSENYQFFRKYQLVSTAEQIVHLVGQNWKSYWKSKKDWTKHPEKYKGMPKPPQYHKKNVRGILKFRDKQIKYVNHQVIFPRSLQKEGITYGTLIPNNVVSCGAEFLPQSEGYILKLMYKKALPEIKPFNNKIAGIDIGINNLVALVSNLQIQPIVYNGKIIKSINNFYNKQRAKYQGILDKQNRYTGQQSIRLQRITQKRYRQISSMFHKITAHIVEQLEQMDISVLVFGYNSDWKNGVKMGHKNNQRFVGIPYEMLKNQLEYKCRLKGIDFKITEESYTSKCSFIDMEDIKKHSSYSGSRVKRGLFKSSNGTLINADVNGAYNIIRKVFAEAFLHWNFEAISGVLYHPKKITIK